jgi:hypothetical protein
MTLMSYGENKRKMSARITGDSNRQQDALKKQQEITDRKSYQQWFLIINN